jgi:hypothetical protein
VVSKEDDAWRAIIDNYGDRPDLDEDTDPPVESAPESHAPEPAPEPVASWDDAFPDSDWSTDRFVPPPPPPLPAPTTDRLIAWLGVFGSPVVLLVCLVFGIDLPKLLGYLLVGSFVGGFLYLVVQMPRGPRDPNDDGAQV